MKIIVVGGTGTLGKATIALLGAQHEIVAVGHRGGDLTVDLKDAGSIQSMFEKIGPFDALIVSAMRVPHASLDEVEEAAFFEGLKSKLMGQVNLVLLGRRYVRDNGSFTLTSGMVSGAEPIRGGIVIATVHAAIEGFVQACACELTRGVRINAVAPTIVRETLEKMRQTSPNLASIWSGYEPVALERVALAYRKSVEGIQTGRIYRVWGDN